MCNFVAKAISIHQPAAFRIRSNIYRYSVFATGKAIHDAWVIHSAFNINQNYHVSGVVNYTYVPQTYVRLEYHLTSLSCIETNWCCLPRQTSFVSR